MMQAPDLVKIATKLIAQHGERALAYVETQARSVASDAPAAARWARIADTLRVIGDIETDQHQRAA